MCTLIADHDLKPDDLPEPNADWEVISEFALTCNGYERWKDVGDFANAVIAGFSSRVDCRKNSTSRPRGTACSSSSGGRVKPTTPQTRTRS